MEKDNDKENARRLEIMRLAKLADETTVESLLDEALAGKSKDASTASRLWKFVYDVFGPDVKQINNPGSPTSRKFWAAISAFLEDAGLDRQQINAIHKPYPAPGDPGFETVFDEMLHDGLISQADYDFVQKL